MYSTADRLNYIMETRNLKQVDILKLSAPFSNKYNVKLNRNDLSQYVNGKVEPGQFKLFILAQALNVSEAWLMGFDVPMQRETPQKPVSPQKDNEELHNLIDMLDSIDQAEIKGTVKQMLKSEKYAGEKANLA